MATPETVVGGGWTENASRTGAPGVTVTVDDPPFPSLVAVIDAVPGTFPVTRPFASTVAIAGAFVDHVTGRPVRATPLASFGVADN